MTKQEQIEEMAKIVDEMYNVYTTTADDIAEGLYNAGYRKTFNEKRFENNMRAVLEIEKKQAVKEFAEKCMDGVGYGSDERIIKNYLDEFMKEYEK